MIEAPSRFTTCTEEMRVGASRLVRTFDDLVHEGNVRRIIVKNEEGDPIVEFPLTAGLIGAILLPQVAAVAAIAGIAARYRLIVERTDIDGPCD